MRNSKLSHLPAQRGIISLFIIILLSVFAFFIAIDPKLIDKIKDFVIVNSAHVVLGKGLSLAIATITIVALVVWIKDRFVLLVVKERQQKLASIASLYNQRFSAIQTAMIEHYSLYDQEAVCAINEARALLGTLIQRLINVGLFLGGGERIHIYDALDQVSQPLVFGENSISVLLTTEPFQTTSIDNLEKRLRELLKTGEAPIKQLNLPKKNTLAEEKAA